MSQITLRTHYQQCQSQMKNDTRTLEEKMKRIKEEECSRTEMITTSLNNVVKAEYERVGNGEPVYVHVMMSYYKFIDRRDYTYVVTFTTKSAVDEFSGGLFTEYESDPIETLGSETVYGHCLITVVLDSNDTAKQYCTTVKGRPVRTVKDLLRNRKLLKKEDLKLVEKLSDAMSTEEGRFVTYKSIEELALYNKAEAEQHKELCKFARTLRTCAHCNARDFKLPRCSCKQVHYCGPKCQNEHWYASHKDVCTFVPE